MGAGDFLVFVGTVALGAVSVWQTKKANDLSERAAKLAEKANDISEKLLALEGRK